VDPRLREVPAVVALGEELSGIASGLYVGGSVATGDYHPGVSDIDAVAKMTTTPSPALRARLVSVHERRGGEHEHASALNCAYVSRDRVGDVERKHWTWAFGELFRPPQPSRTSGTARGPGHRLALTVWARVDATMTDGVLITKSAAIVRMAERGVPADIVDGVARRRAGQPVVLTDAERADRAVRVRRFLREEFAKILGQQ
jgi:hypothetical protein